MFRKKVMLSAMCAGAMFATTVFAQDAQTILKETGVRGGFVVHLGAGDGRLTADLHATDSYLVHGLALNATNLEAARKHVKSKDLYGKVTVDLFNSEILPYNDNFVDLLVADTLGAVTMEEVTRVLAPLGVAYINGKKTIKPRPDNITDWTHFTNTSAQNMVADDDEIGPPNHLQWKAKPDWVRSHEQAGRTMRGMISSEKRTFTLIDTGLIGVGPAHKLPVIWELNARSAFSGALLWRKKLNTELTTPDGSAQKSRVFVANNQDDVFVPMGKDSVLFCLDAATGEVKKEYNVKFVNEVSYSDGRLLVSCRSSSKKDSQTGEIVMLDAKNGEILWSKKVPAILAFSLTWLDDKVIYHDFSNVVMLNGKDGSEKWRYEHKSKAFRQLKTTFVLTDRAVLMYVHKKNGPILSISTEDGSLLWSKTRGQGKSCSTNSDIFVMKDDTVYFGLCEVGYDVVTGEVKNEIKNSDSTNGHHARCYRSRATNKYFLFPYRGVEFSDLSGKGEHRKIDWVRSNCNHGFLTANGMLHSTPDPCACYPGVLLKGFNAMREKVNFPKAKEDIRFVKGKAYAKFSSKTATQITNDNDWPNYRNDVSLSGNLNADIPTTLEQKWESNLKGDLTPASYANGKLYICDKKNNTLYCLNGSDGKILWEYIAGGTIDLPPTIYNGTALFGSGDGWVHSLDANSGELSWKFRAAPEARLILNDNKLSSPWPVHGALTVLDDVAYFAAGHSTYLDGGIYIYGLNPLTGEKRYETLCGNPYEGKTRVNKGNEAFDMLGSLNDVLTTDGEYLYMLQMMFDKELNEVEAKEITEFGDRKMGKHLIATNGFLDDSNYNRIAWVFSKRWPGFYSLNQAPKAGQILSFDDKQTYGVKFFTTRNGNSPLIELGEKGYLLFADHNDSDMGLVDGKNPEAWKSVKWLPAVTFKGKRPDRQDRYNTPTVNNDKGTGFTRNKMPVWMKWVKVRVRGMVSTKNALFIMGIPDVVEANDPYAAFDGKLGSVIQAVSKTDGELINEIKTESQVVFDGMMAADGKLIVVLKNGKVLCY